MKEEKKGSFKILTVFIAACVGIVLLILGSGKREDTGKSDGISVMSEVGNCDEAKYEEKLVKKIESVCSSVRGAGKVSVAVTLDGSYKAIYAQNYADGSSIKREYFLVGRGTTEAALLLGYSPPKILGVAIVCSGGANDAVRAEIISLVSALLDLPTNKIYVAAAKN